MVYSIQPYSILRPRHAISRSTSTGVFEEILYVKHVIDTRLDRSRRRKNVYFVCHRNVSVLVYHLLSIMTAFTVLDELLQRPLVFCHTLLVYVMAFSLICIMLGVPESPYSIKIGYNEVLS